MKKRSEKQQKQLLHKERQNENKKTDTQKVSVFYYFFLRPKMAISPAKISADMAITPAIPPAVETGMPGAGVGVAGMGVAVKVGVEVGHGVLVGGMVGVEVGRVGVGVNAD
jgi:hypothetical protein